MPYSDEKFGQIFPTRNGAAIGGAGERQMLDAIGGSDSFRTRISQNADGSETLLRTKGGMPQFETIITKQKDTTDTVERTFVFTDRDLPTTATVANRSGANFAVVLTKLAVKLKAAYSVMLTKAASLGSAYRAGVTAANNWRDVARLDDATPKLIGGIVAPNPLTDVGVAGLPGLPVIFDRDHTNFYASRIVAGFNDEYTMSGPNRVYKVGVAIYKTDGTVLSFVPAVGTAAYVVSQACGVQLKQGMSGNLYGDYMFHWQGQDPATDGDTTTSCYSKIRVSPFALPAVSESSSTVTKFAQVEFGSIGYTINPASNTDSVVGNYYSYQEQVWYGPDFSSVSPYGYALISASKSWAGPKDVYTAVKSSGWAKSINYADTYNVGAGNAELQVDRSVVGSENWVDRGGGIGADSTRHYYPTIGTESRWTRTANSIAKTYHKVLGRNLYFAQYQQTSDGLLGQIKSPTVTWDWRDISRPLVNLGGIQWVYFLDTANYGAYNASAITNCKANMAANNATVQRNAAANTLPPDYGTSAPVTITYPADNYQTRRIDNGTLTIDTRDYIFYDPEENVSLSLVGKIRHTRTRTKTPWDYNIETQPVDGEWSGSTSVEAYYELEVRGVLRTISAYTNNLAWWPDIAFGNVLEKGAPYVWEKRFSGAHIPGEPNLYFAPMYMHQGRCPWIAYTTLVEEANGATPEFYIDLKIKPYTGKNTLSEGESYDNVVVFRAFNLEAAFRNYMGKNAPTDVFENEMFVSPKRISIALGISESNGWQSKLGAPFSVNSHVTITRI